MGKYTKKINKLITKYTGFCSKDYFPEFKELKKILDNEFIITEEVYLQTIGNGTISGKELKKMPPSNRLLLFALYSEKCCANKKRKIKELSTQMRDFKKHVKSTIYPKHSEFLSKQDYSNGISPEQLLALEEHFKVK